MEINEPGFFATIFINNNGSRLSREANTQPIVWNQSLPSSFHDQYKVLSFQMFSNQLVISITHLFRIKPSK